MYDRYSEVNYAVSTMKRGLVIYSVFAAIRGVSDFVGQQCAKILSLIIFIVYVLCVAVPKYLYLRAKGREQDGRGDNFGDKVTRAWYWLILRRPVGLSPRFVKKAIAIINRTEEGRQALAHIREHGIWEEGYDGCIDIPSAKKVFRPKVP